MKLHRIEWSPLRIPFRRPLHIGGVAVVARVGILLRAYGDNGLIGLGELALHPTAGPDVLRDATQALAALQQVLLSNGPVEISPWVPDDLGRLVPAMARAGVEMACCDLAARTAGIRVAAMWGPMVREEVPVNALIDQQEPRAAAATAGHLVAEGYHCLKLKVSHDLAAAAARVAAVRAAVGADVSIRLDANEVWTVDEAIAAIRRLAAYEIAYVEQPVRGIADLAQVRGAVETLIAADECVTDVESVHRIAAMKAADIVVVKPALVGLRTAAAIIRSACTHGLKVVVTSALDTTIGIAAALHLAATLPDPVLPCGLATASLLEGDLVREPLVPHRGWLRLPSGPGLGVQLDEAALRRWRVAHDS